MKTITFTLEIEIDDTAEATVELPLALEHATSLIEKGFTSGYYPEWNMTERI